MKNLDPHGSVVPKAYGVVKETAIEQARRLGGAMNAEEAAEFWRRLAGVNHEDAFAFWEGIAAESSIRELPAVTEPAATAKKCPHCGDIREGMCCGVMPPQPKNK